MVTDITQIVFNQNYHAEHVAWHTGWHRRNGTQLSTVCSINSKDINTDKSIMTKAFVIRLYDTNLNLLRHLNKNQK